MKVLTEKIVKETSAERPPAKKEEVKKSLNTTIDSKKTSQKTSKAKLRLTPNLKHRELVKSSKVMVDLDQS